MRRRGRWDEDEDEVPEELRPSGSRGSSSCSAYKTYASPNSDDAALDCRGDRMPWAPRCGGEVEPYVSCT